MMTVATSVSQQSSNYHGCSRPALAHNCCGEPPAPFNACPWSARVCIPHYMTDIISSLFHTGRPSSA